jgi:UDP-GlcNAc3NAcA epimerase
VHTGQHYDQEMSDIFFDELQIPQPDYNLGIGSGLHGKQTGEILANVEQVLIQEKPDLMLIYGDTNSTLAGALAAVKLHIPVAHVEAGLRSFDRTMPEEINRVLTDHVSDLLFCPTQTAVENLRKEGITTGVHLVGDVMADALLFNRKIAEDQSTILDRLGVSPKKYFVFTVHRPSNTNNRNHMENIIKALGKADDPVVFPVHPRTRKYLEDYGMLDQLPENFMVIAPLGYIDMIRLMSSMKKILTDSGGMQKEAYMLGVPCVTLRDNTEWLETLQNGWNILAGSRENEILLALQMPFPKRPRYELFPPGASEKIRNVLNSMG